MSIKPSPRRGLLRKWSWLTALALSSSIWAAPLMAQEPVDRSALHEMSWGRATMLLAEVLEYAPESGARSVHFDLIGWTGSAMNRFVLKADGSVATVGQGTHGEYQALYGRLVSPFWDAQFGLRTDLRSAAGTSASRTGLLVGLQGLAPGWFELEPSLFVPTDGNASLGITGSYDLYLTQRLVLQPRLETSLSLRDDPEFGIGRGVAGSSFGIRTRYELRREFAPYLGVVWEREFGRTAELARLAGLGTSDLLLVLGLRLWR